MISTSLLVFEIANHLSFQIQKGLLYKVCSGYKLISTQRLAMVTEQFDETIMAANIIYFTQFIQSMSSLDYEKIKTRCY